MKANCQSYTEVKQPNETTYPKRLQAGCLWNGIMKGGWQPIHNSSVLEDLSIIIGCEVRRHLSSAVPSLLRNQAGFDDRPPLVQCPDKHAPLAKHCLDGPGFGLAPAAQGRRPTPTPESQPAYRSHLLLPVRHHRRRRGRPDVLSCILAPQQPMDRNWRYRYHLQSMHRLGRHDRPPTA
jgi:hypothetical protein